MTRLHAVAGIVCLAVLAGCSGDKGGGDAGGEPAAAGTQPVAVAGIDAATRLDLDDGRVSVFSPTGWRRAPRSKDYLVRYQQKDVSLPSVVVLAADPPGGVTEVTSQTQGAFLEAFATLMAEQFGSEGKPAFIRKPAAVTVGPHRGVSWAVPGEVKLDGPPKKIERDCTAVVIDGRMYTVETWGARGRLDDATKTTGRAVAAALAIPTLDEPEPLIPLPSGETPAPEPAKPEPGEPAPQPTEPEPAEPKPAEPVGEGEPAAKPTAEPAPAEPAAAEPAGAAPAAE